MNTNTNSRAYDFMKGYSQNVHPKYMNLGYLTSPFPGKMGEGDYGPLQGGEIYYVPKNPTYPYPMDDTAPFQNYTYSQIKNMVRLQETAKLKKDAKEWDC